MAYLVFQGVRESIQHADAKNAHTHTHHREQGAHQIGSQVREGKTNALHTRTHAQPQGVCVHVCFWLVAGKTSAF